MRILWVSTAPLGPAGRILKMSPTGSSGGWIQNEYEILSRTPDDTRKMFFLCASRSVKKGQVRQATTEEGTAYCVHLPRISFGKEPDAAMLHNMQQIIQQVRPDIIHIWGTESVVSYCAVKASANIKKVVFIQGLIGIHNRYKGGYLERCKENDQYLYKGSLFNRLIDAMKRSCFEKQIAYEQHILRNSHSVIIDNAFSQSYCQAVNPDISCYYRFLHPAPHFYQQSWNRNAYGKNTIFTVFGQSREKGLHQLLKAVAMLKEKFTDVKLIVPGPFNAENGKLKDKKYLTTYEAWLSNFICANGLQDTVCFIGQLNAPQMVQHLSECSVFVNPSCMEVHALSLREAMAVGAPCITSLCGSVIEYAQHGTNALIYRYEEFEMLAYLIDRVFSDRELAYSLSENAKACMIQRNRAENLPLEEIYRNTVKQI